MKKALIGVIAVIALMFAISMCTDNHADKVPEATEKKTYTTTQKADTTKSEPKNFTIIGPIDDSKVEQSIDTTYYVGNTKTKKFHYPYCNYLPNKENAIKIPKEKISQYSNYSPCGHCDPLEEPVIIKK